MKQNSLTVIAYVKAGETAKLEATLETIGGNIAGNGLINFGAIETLHFCCWVLVQDDPAFPTSLVWECNHDGDAESQVDEFLAKGRAGLEAIYVHCEGYSASNLKKYLLDHSVETAAFYIGCPGQSVKSIQNAISVRQAIENFLDQNKNEFGRLNPLNVHRRLKEYLQNGSPVKPIASEATLDQQKKRAWRNIILFGLFALPIVIITLPALLAYVVFLRALEAKEARQPAPPGLKVDPRLFEHEDIFVMNHLTTMVNVKPGALRLATLKVVLWIIDLLAKIFFITGNLGGIPTIHFARWILMENDRRLLFFSNYDGSWASYLGDFVDKANYGLTGVWSNTERFPPASFLFLGGAQNIEEFKAWSREHNLYAGIWYSAYPDETLWNLQKDVRIRDAVLEDLDEAGAKKLLQLL